MTKDKKENKENICTKPLDEAIKDYLESGTQQSIDSVIRKGKGLVRHFAYVYSGGKYNEDFLQAGYEGFLKAIDRYNEAYENSFSTFAGHYIMGEIRHFIRKEATYYKPYCIADLQAKYDKLVNEYYMEHGSLPPIELMAKKLNVKPEGIANIMCAGLVSFDQLDVDQISSSCYESFRLPIEDRIVLEQAVKKLSDTQRKVIYLLYYHGMTQVQVADKLGMNQRKVSRILHISLDSLRTDMMNA